MNIQEIISSLSPLERQVVKHLSLHNSFEDLVKKTGLQEVEVSRALQWLQNKGIVKIENLSSQVVVLGENGKKYVGIGLPEKKILDTLISAGSLSLSDVVKKTGLSEQEVSACIGVLRSKFAIETSKAEELILKVNDNGKKLIKEGFPEEKLLKRISSAGVIEISTIQDLEKLAFENLKKRRDIIKVEERNSKIIILEKDIDLDLLKKSSDVKYIESLTPEMIRDKSYVGKKFRGYDVKSQVPALDRGKRHFVDQAINYIKKIWLEMGFKEMEGDIVQTAFWDLDSLFVPQDHPAREMQDTFYLGNNKKVSHGKLPSLSKIVKDIHENGGKTGSRGWGGKWSEDDASEILLRTHTTVLSAHTIFKLKKEDLPAKFFAVNRVYRNEALDWKHLFEFNQVEGIVIDPNANFKHLIGYLKAFYKKMGYLDVRLRPSHFPYTEPSVEVDVLHPVKKEWIELGGAGIFRPEVSIALLGYEVPILAWGQGMERVISSYYQITDIRQLYDNDLKRLKEIKEWML